MTVLCIASVTFAGFFEHAHAESLQAFVDIESFVKDAIKPANYGTQIQIFFPLGCVFAQLCMIVLVLNV